MTDNAIIRLKKQREEEATQASYLTMNSLELAASKYMDELPPSVLTSVNRVLRNKEAIEDQALHVRHISSASQCGLLQHLDLYLTGSSGGGDHAMLYDDQSFTSVLTMDHHIGHEHGDNGAGMVLPVDPSFNSEESKSTVTPLLALPPSVPSTSSQSGTSEVASRQSSEQLGLVDSHSGDGVVPTIQNMAMVTVNESLRASIENVIRCLVSVDPIFHGDDTKESGRKSRTSSVGGGDGDDAESSKRSAAASLRSNSSIDDQVIDEVQREANSLAEAITKHILASAMLRATPFVDNSQPVFNEADAVSEIARAITPSIIAEAITAVCHTTLGHGMHDNDSDVQAVSQALTDSVTPRLIAENLSAACSARQEEKEKESDTVSPSKTTKQFKAKAELPKDHDFDPFVAHQYNSHSDPPPEDNNDGNDVQEDDALVSFQAHQYSEHVETEDKQVEEVVELPSVATLAEDPLYHEVFVSTSRGLRVLDTNSRQNTEDVPLFDYLQQLHGRIRNLKDRVYSRQCDLMLVFSKWSHDLEAKRSRESEEASQSSASSSRGGISTSGSTRLSIMQRDAWLKQLKIEREQQKIIDEANRIQFFEESEMYLEDLLAAQLELSCALEEKIGLMVNIETTYEDAILQTDRGQLLRTDDFISNTRSLGTKIMELDVALSYAAFCFQRTYLDEKVKSGTSIARLESAVTTVEKEKVKRVKVFNPRKGIRFRINTAPRPPPPPTEDRPANESNDIENEPGSGLGGVGIEDPMNSTPLLSGEDRKRDSDAEGDGDSAALFPVRDMYTPPASAGKGPIPPRSKGGEDGQNLMDEARLLPSHDENDIEEEDEEERARVMELEREREKEIERVQRKARKKERRRLRRIRKEEAAEREARELAAERAMTPEERKAAAREKKKQRSASREQARLQALRELEEEEEEEDAFVFPLRLMTASTIFSFESSEAETSDSRDTSDLDSPTRIRSPQRKKRRKKIVVEEEPEPEPEPQEETLGQRRVRKRAEAKALKMSEEEKARALLPPIKVVKPPVDTNVLTKAQRRIQYRKAKQEKKDLERFEKGFRTPTSQDGGVSPRVGTAATEEPQPVSRSNSFFSFANVFGQDKHPAGPNPRKNEVSYHRQESVALERIDPLKLTEVNVPLSYDGTLRVRIKYMDSAKITPGFYVIGFHTDCKAQGILRERDRIEEIDGQSLAGWDPEDVANLLENLTAESILFTIKRHVKTKPLLRQYSGSDLPKRRIVTQQMLDDNEAELEKAYHAKKKVKKKIKIWTKEYEKRENKVVTAEVKAAHPDVFGPLDQLFTYISAQEMVVDDMRVELRRGDEKNPFISHQYGNRRDAVPNVEPVKSDAPPTQEFGF